jgi:hypothetical protein
MAHWCRLCQEEKEKREAELAAKARRLQEAEEEKRRIHEGREKRLQALKYEFEIKPHHVQEEYVKQYARKNLKNLLTNADEIRSSFLNCVSVDLEFTQRLKTEYPELYALVSFPARAVAYAEQLWAEVDRQPQPKRTADDVRVQLINRMVRDVKDEQALEDMFVSQGITDLGEQQKLRQKFDDLKAERAQRRENQSEHDKIV